MGDKLTLGGDPIKYGYVSGPRSIVSMPLAASVVFGARYGCFVYVNGSGYITRCADGTPQIIGWADVPNGSADFTSSSTAGQDWVDVDISTSSLYRMAVGDTGTIAVTDRLETCDLVYDDTNDQKLDIDSSAEDVVQMVSIDVTNNNAIVRINPNKTCVQGVA